MKVGFQFDKHRLKKKNKGRNSMLIYLKPNMKVKKKKKKKSTKKHKAVGKE